MQGRLHREQYISSSRGYYIQTKKGYSRLQNKNLLTKAQK